MLSLLLKLLAKKDEDRPLANEVIELEEFKILSQDEYIDKDIN